MRAFFLATLLLISLTQSAGSFGLGRMGQGMGQLGAIGTTKKATALAGALLLVNGTSYLLLVDGVNRLKLL